MPACARDRDRRPLTLKTSALGNNGTMGILCGLLAVILCAAGLGLVGILRLWHSQARLQLSLDRCVAETADAARSDLEAIDSDNARMLALRITLAAASIAPPARAAAQAALQLAYLHQTGKILSFRLRQARWLARRGCQGEASVALPIASLPITRDPPDSLGPQPLRWLESDPRFYFQLTHPPRHSRASLGKKQSAENEGSHDSFPITLSQGWSLRWRAPIRF